jgi:hypothetical protein
LGCSDFLAKEVHHKMLDRSGAYRNAFSMALGAERTAFVLTHRIGFPTATLALVHILLSWKEY